jgi:hypothetical protein
MQIDNVNVALRVDVVLSLPSNMCCHIGNQDQVPSGAGLSEVLSSYQLPVME